MTKKTTTLPLIKILPLYTPFLGYSQITILPLILLQIPLTILFFLLPLILVLFTQLPLLPLQDTLSF